MTNDKILRQHLDSLLGGRQAHLNFKDVVDGLPPGLQGKKPEGATHTPWQLLEHLRIAQWDILEFSRSPHHISPDFPDGYWPDTEFPPSEKAWQSSVSAFLADLRAIREMVADPSTDLYAKIPHGTGQTILREALLVADHNAYHLGQLVLVRKMLGCPPAA